MVGLAIVLVYVLAAVFAPYITPYNPMEDMYLADRLAAPAWIGKVNPKYQDWPATSRNIIAEKDWHVEQDGGATISKTEFDRGAGVDISIPARAEGEGSGDGVVLSYGMKYAYQPPQTFSAKFDYTVDAPDDAVTKVRLEMISPDGTTHDLWDAAVNGSQGESPAIADARDFDMKMRMGLSFFDDPATVVFSQKGDYLLRFLVSSESPSGPASVRISPVTFEILGLLHGVLGTDHMGSDLWAQLIYGTRLALIIGLASAFISVAIGTTVGIVSGYVGGALDEFLMRLVDVLLSIPDLPILIVLGALFGKSLLNVVIIVSAFAWMGIARIIRSQTLTLKERTFIEAARASGASGNYIMAAHILPNVTPLIFANLVLRIPGAILTEAALSFLGLGDPRVPTWGRMLQNARQFGAFTELAWWWLLPPGFALTFLSLAFVFIGNTVNEVLNPRYRERS